MALEITGIRMSDTGDSHEHIILYGWKMDADGKAGNSNKTTMVQWVDANTGKAFSGSGDSRVPVQVERREGTDPYLRSRADGVWTNNLLALPRI